MTYLHADPLQPMVSCNIYAVWNKDLASESCPLLWLSPNTASPLLTLNWPKVPLADSVAREEPGQVSLLRAWRQPQGYSNDSFSCHARGSVAENKLSMKPWNGKPQPQKVPLLPGRSSFLPVSTHPHLSPTPPHPPLLTHPSTPLHEETDHHCCS